eukprot:TRINITY_DN11889_c0_g1_i1.p1 TRINITY_DN11889_c0_g1~~TRINITY_DN11889_c0_g1_i1.p1  ORF type:complete len:532 (+),score=209.98 TRINITY_DN11889_c0_g1_i1:29-1597(+)
MRNKQDIQLIFETLEYLGEIGKETKKNNDLRSLIINLCDFQERFSTPLELPFGLGSEFASILPTPRPIKVLLEHKTIFKTDKKPEIEMYVENEGGEFFVFAGGEIWKDMLKNNKLIDEDEKKEPTKNGFLWIKDLFKIFREENKNPKSRRLAGCWYYTASQINFDEEDEEEEDINNVDPMEQKLKVMADLGLLNKEQGGEKNSLTGLLNLDDYDSNEDNDFEPDDNEEDESVSDDSKDEEESPKKRKLVELLDSNIKKDVVIEEKNDKEDLDDGKSDKEDMDEKEDEETNKNVKKVILKDLPPRKKRLEGMLDLKDYKSDEDNDFQPDEDEEDESFEDEGKLTKKKLLNEKGDKQDDNEEEDEDDEDFNPDEGDDYDERDDEGVSEGDGQSMKEKILSSLFGMDNESQVSFDTREYILDTIEELKAFMPSPDTHMPFYKRMLVEMNPKNIGNLKWFPFGMPPLQTMITAIQEDDDEDEDMCTFLREVLTPFASVQQQDEGDEEGDENMDKSDENNNLIFEKK